MEKWQKGVFFIASCSLFDPMQGPRDTPSGAKYLTHSMGFPSDPEVKNPPAMQDPWVRKIPWRRKWQPNPVFLPGKSHGQNILVGYSPWGCDGVRHNLVT